MSGRSLRNARPRPGFLIEARSLDAAINPQGLRLEILILPRTHRWNRTIGGTLTCCNPGKRWADRSMHHHSKYLMGVLGAVSAALCFAVVLALPAPIAGPQPDARVAPGMFDTVNRASKGDRLRVIVRPPDTAPFEVQAPGGSSPKSLDGCESAFGQMDHSAAARLAQSCTT
jgi:hypothetical protein